MNMNDVFINRLTTMSLQSVLEVSHAPAAALKQYCVDRDIQHHHCLPSQCSDVSQRFDLAIVHNLDDCPLAELRPSLGLLKNLISERVWLLIDEDYCPSEYWIGLGFKPDTMPEPIDRAVASYSYNLETYNHKRDWNNPRFWANPEHWDKRF